MKVRVLVFVLMGFGFGARASQTLQDAIQMRPSLGLLVSSIEEGAKVKCLPMESLMSRSIGGPNGQAIVTQQAPCYDPNEFNPTQIGQILLSYYGSGESRNSEVGDLVSVEFAVFK